MKRITFVAVFALAVTAAHTQTRTGLCMLSASEKGEGATFIVHHTDCEEGNECGTSDHTNVPWSRWTGVSAQSLAQNGAALEARLHADAGDLRCNGSVHDGILTGHYTFASSADYSRQLQSLGLEEMPDRRLEGYAMLDVSIDYVKQLQAAGVTGLSSHHILSMKALNVTPTYISEMTAAGYPEHDAHKLTSMKAVGVTPEKVKEAKSLGFEPTQHELTQMCVFHIDRAFVEKMRSRGLKDLTLAKLVKIKVFKLDE